MCSSAEVAISKLVSYGVLDNFSKTAVKITLVESSAEVAVSKLGTYGFQNNFCSKAAVKITLIASSAEVAVSKLGSYGCRGMQNNPWNPIILSEPGAAKNLLL
jgi:hypothetical protein